MARSFGKSANLVGDQSGSLLSMQRSIRSFFEGKSFNHILPRSKETRKSSLGHFADRAGAQMSFKPPEVTLITIHCTHLYVFSGADVEVCNS